MKKPSLLICCLLILAFAAGARAENKTGALGRFSPKQGIVDLLGVSGQVVDRILVKEGDRVSQEQPLAVFANQPLLALDLDLAVLAEQEARDRAGHAVEMQASKVAAAVEDLAFARQRRDNFGQYVGESLSKQQMELRKYTYREAELKLAAEKSQLELTKVDGRVGAARAAKQVELARKRLEAAVLKAPMAGTVLNVLKSEGETCGGGPLIRMADLGQMYVIAEIYEGDLLGVKVGMPATVTSSILPRELHGRVETIGRIVAKNTKVADVWIRLDEPDIASRLLNMEVNVSIDKNSR